MLNNNKDYKKIKNYCRKYLNYGPGRGEYGCTINSETICDHLHNMGFNAKLLNVKGRYILSEITGYSKAVVMFYDNKGFGHTMAWDGCKYFDPGSSNPGIHAEKKLPKYYYSSEVSALVILIKTPIYQRTLNIIKKPFIDLIY